MSYFNHLCKNCGKVSFVYVEDSSNLEIIKENIKKIICPICNKLMNECNKNDISEAEI